VIWPAQSPLDALWIECVGGPIDGAAVRAPAGADPVTLNGYAYRRTLWTERAPDGEPTWERVVLRCEGPA
jgi:hypothetical protein